MWRNAIGMCLFYEWACISHTHTHISSTLYCVDWRTKCEQGKEREQEEPKRLSERQNEIERHRVNYRTAHTKNTFTNSTHTRTIWTSWGAFKCPIQPKALCKWRQSKFHCSFSFSFSFGQKWFFFLLGLCWFAPGQHVLYCFVYNCC